MLPTLLPTEGRYGMASKTRSDGDGSIYFEAARNRYVGSMVTGWRDGKPIRRKVSAKSRADAARKLRDLRDKVNAGTLPSGRVPTVAEWMQHWHTEIAPGKVRATTLPGYGNYIDGYIVPLLGSHRLDRLRPEHVESAWRTLMTTGRPGGDGKPLSSTTALQAHRILARALKVAQQRGMVQRNVATMIDAPGKVDVEIQPLTKDEGRRVLDAAAGTRLAARWRVALSLGLRQGEALGLGWEHVDLENGAIHIRRSLARIKGQGLVLGKPKSRAGRRTVSVPPALLRELKAHRLAQNAERLAAGSKWAQQGIEGLVFTTELGDPIDPRADWQAWKELLETAGVPHRSLHAARHTAATMLLAQGVAPRVVMEILGHSQISVTSRYQHVVDDMQRDAVSRVDDLWG